MLININGISGSGKSSVRKELQHRGYDAYDTDEGGITAWRNTETSEIVERPEGKDSTRKWYEQHEWMMSREKVEELAELAKHKLVFLCGSTANENEMWDLFGKTICLTIDEETLRHRIATRTTNDFGKTTAELGLILKWHKILEQDNRHYGAVMIDATRPLDEVVDDIVAVLKV